MCYINPSVFNDFLNTNAAFSFAILKQISEDSLLLSEKLQNYKDSLLPGKVSKGLLYLSNQIYGSDTFELPLTRTEFAQFVGGSRERVSKVLHDLNNDRIITMNNTYINIEHKDLLYKLSKLG